MPGQRSTVCGNTQASDPTASFHRIPKETVIRATWMSLFDLKEEDIKPSTRVCCRHFPNGDAKKMPDMTLGKSDCLICLLPVNHIVNSRSAYTTVV